MKIKTFFLNFFTFFIINLILFSCQKKSNDEQSIDFYSPVTNKFSPVNQDIHNIINKWQTSCAINGEYCKQKATLSAGKAKENASSEGYRVLIIDDSAMALAAYTRYRNRVLGNYIEDSNGKIVEDNRQIEIPLAANEILTDILNNEKYGFVPAEKLNVNQDEFNKNFANELSQKQFIDESSGHSTNIFNFIANNSPQAQFVLIHKKPSNFEKIVCDNKSSDEEKKSNLYNYFIKKSGKIIEVIKKYHIKFISLSEGISHESLSKLNCNLSDDFMKEINESYFRDFLVNIVYKNDVILFQANVSANEIIDRNDKKYYSDCKLMQNRIRVGVVNTLNRNIPEYGLNERNSNIVIGKNKNSEQCTDVYINIAVETARPFNFAQGVVEFSIFNVGTTKPVGTDVVSSFSTPIAVSFFLNEKLKNLNINTADDVFEHFKKLRGEKNPEDNKNYLILDPALHKQFSIYKFGYLN
ncbi:hypothetical protein QEJ31_06100 [Pigmentibacter sp. JX0631]|uniref:hypothetical protein n=1 Tax=Pigmentibacter sp. JX0631 TaxID=2976982 RepID=UPI0024699BBB|nr:hypothetical protein [Pigmentibacter sp. JX0631]WGL61167.1 hypothetical protein QEJ31_06100 [Pigmentibacter sp. JX0631]